MRKTTISQYQIQQFRYAGYLKHNKILPKNITDKLISVIKKEISDEKLPFRRNKKGIIYRLNGVYNRHTAFRKLVRHEYIVGVLKALLGPNIEFALNRHNHATINCNTNWRFHRDILHWSRGLVSVIVYLEDATTANGCTEIIPCSQFLPYSGKPNNGGTWLDDQSKYSEMRNQGVPIPMPRGGILFFDSTVFHTAGKNTSGISRMSITLGYHSVDELSKYSSDTFKVTIAGKRIYRGNIPFEQ